MAEENGNVSDLTIEVLKSIRSELQGMRGEMRDGLAEVRRGLDQTNARLDETNARLDETNAKLEQLADFTQTGFKALIGQADRRFLDHEGRLRRLEEHAGFEPHR